MYRGGWIVGPKSTYRGKVATLATVLIPNNLSGYTTGYKFLKVATTLVINDLSGYINDKGDHADLTVVGT